MKKLFIIFILISMMISAAAESLNISGVDPSKLLRTQNIDLFLTVTGDDGKPVSSAGLNDLRLYESADLSEGFNEIENFTIEQDTNLKDGIDIFLLVDNSGSMYYNLQGRGTNDVPDMRMTHVENALNNFLSTIKDSRDRISLASFNTGYQYLSSGTARKSSIMESFDNIERPDTEESYTELYAAIKRTVPHIKEDAKGRKVIVVLSDGENWSYYEKSGNPHPEFGEKVFTPDEAVNALKESGVTLFAINYGKDEDPALDRIAEETGGKSFDAFSPDELAGIYDFIREALLEEVRIRYRAGVYQSDVVHVKVENTEGETAEATYFAKGLFGNMSSLPLFLILIILELSLLLWLLLTKIKLEKSRKLPYLEVVGGGLSQRTLVDITKDRTVIGTSNSDDLTLAGDSPESDTGSATILYDKEKKGYTLVAENGAIVNNQKVTKRDLESGDVIKVGNDLVIFDDEAVKKQNGKNSTVISDKDD